MSRKIFKIWFATGGIGSIPEQEFQRQFMAGLAKISDVTLGDFVVTKTKTGSHTQVYPATDEMMWQKMPSYRKDKLIPLGMQKGTWIYITTRNRWTILVSAVAIHEMGHRFKIAHSHESTSIMNPSQTSLTMNQNDIRAFQGKIGAK